jgi:hypothetical protein
MLGLEMQWIAHTMTGQTNCNRTTARIAFKGCLSCFWYQHRLRGVAGLLGAYRGF